MNERNIHIGSLEVRLKGIDPAIARAAAEGLGDELLSHLSSAGTGSRGRSVRIDAIDAGEHRVARGMSAEELRRAIVRRIGDEIERSLI